MLSGNFLKSKATLSLLTCCLSLSSHSVLGMDKEQDAFSMDLEKIHFQRKYYAGNVTVTFENKRSITLPYYIAQLIGKTALKLKSPVHALSIKDLVSKAKHFIKISNCKTLTEDDKALLHELHVRRFNHFVSSIYYAHFVYTELNLKELPYIWPPESNYFIPKEKFTLPNTELDSIFKTDNIKKYFSSDINISPYSKNITKIDIFTYTKDDIKIDFYCPGEKKRTMISQTSNFNDYVLLSVCDDSLFKDKLSLRFSMSIQKSPSIFPKKKRTFHTTHSQNTRHTIETFPEITFYDDLDPLIVLISEAKKSVAHKEVTEERLKKFKELLGENFVDLLDQDLKEIIPLFITQNNTIMLKDIQNFANIMTKIIQPKFSLDSRKFILNIGSFFYYKQKISLLKQGADDMSSMGPLSYQNMLEKLLEWCSPNLPKITHKQYKYVSFLLKKNKKAFQLNEQETISKERLTKFKEILGPCFKDLSDNDFKEVIPYFTTSRNEIIVKDLKIFQKAFNDKFKKKENITPGYNKLLLQLGALLYHKGQLAHLKILVEEASFETLLGELINKLKTLK